MSKNFELLAHVGQDTGLFEAAQQKVELPVASPVSSPPGDLAHDEVTGLVQRIFFTAREGRAPRAVAFCGVEHGDGASWICAQVARGVAAQKSTTVCAVDANLRSPSLHGYLGIPNRLGLAEAIRGMGSIRKFLQPGPTVNLSVLTAGVDADPTLLLMAERLRERVAELRSEFDYLIFDISGTAHANDGVVLGALLDGMVLVVGAHSTRRETARKAKENLEKGNVHLLGTVLNGRTFPIPASLYRRL